MKTITQEQLLMERIISLQTQQRSELQQLKIQFHMIPTPINIIVRKRKINTTCL